MFAVSHTVKVMSFSRAGSISSANMGLNFKIGSWMPAWRSCMPSGTVAMPSQLIPIRSAMRETSTAPCP